VDGDFSIPAAHSKNLSLGVQPFGPLLLLVRRISTKLGLFLFGLRTLIWPHFQSFCSYRKSTLSPSEVEAFKAAASSMLLRKTPSTAMQTVMKDNAAVRKLTSTSKENQGSKLLKRPTLDRYPE